VIKKTQGSNFKEGI